MSLRIAMGRVLAAVVTAHTSSCSQTVATSPRCVPLYGPTRCALQAVLPRSHRDSGLVTETIQRDLSGFLRYRVATLEAALCRVEELRRAAAQGDLEQCNPPIH